MCYSRHPGDMRGRSRVRDALSDTFPRAPGAAAKIGVIVAESHSKKINYFLTHSWAYKRKWSILNIICSWGSFFFDLLHAFLPSVNVILYGKFYLFVIFDMCIGRGLQRRSKSLVFKRILIKNQ